MNPLPPWVIPGVIAVTCIALGVGGTALLYGRSPPSPASVQAARAPLPVATERLALERGYVRAQQFAGRLEPARRAELAFERSDRLIGVSVDEGDRIEAGEVVARLDTRLLEAEQDRLRGRRRELTARLELARRTARRQEDLARRDHTSEQGLDEARLNREAITGELAALEASLRHVAIQLDKSRLTAPFAGTIAARYRDPGAVVASGTPIVELLETGRPQARVGVSPEAADRLTLGEAVELTQGRRRLQARIIAIRPDLNPSTQTVGILLDVATPDGGPIPRVHETVTLTVSQRVDSPGFWVPMGALTEGRQGLWSLLTLIPAEAGAGYRVGREAVELLYSDGEQAYVRGTLRDGIRIIATGPARVVPGERVVPAEAAATTRDGGRGA